MAPIVRRLDNAIHWISLYTMDNAIRFPVTYPLDSDVSIGYIALSDLYTTGPWSQEMDYDLYYDFISF